MSYLEEMREMDQSDGIEALPQARKQKAKKKKIPIGNDTEDLVGASTATNDSQSKKAKKRSLGGSEEQESVELSSNLKKAKLVFNESTENVDDGGELELSTKLRGKKKRKSESLSQPSTPASGNSEETITPGKAKTKCTSPSSPAQCSTNAILRTPVNKNILTPKSVTSSGLRKRASFVMARNLEHSHADYPKSIQRSPAIPYEPAQQPDFGLLKSPATTKNNGKNTNSNRKSTSPVMFRKRASDYFN